jgi:WD40 repeat protein
VKVSGGQIQGIVGAGSVVVENLTFYSRAPEEPAQTTGAEPIGPCPYPGLAYFGPNDADLFFGRDAAITRLAEAVGRQSFTALIGASGSGKSSVVLAGLAPRLHSDRAGNWRFSHFRVGTELDRNPFLALARALVPLYVDSDSDTERLRNTKQLATSLQTGDLTLGDVFADCRSRNKGTRILLIADQFEEAFTFVSDEAVRHRFIDVLLAGFPDTARGGTTDICLILTMRGDFYGQALHYRPFADALQDHVENLGPMSRDELRAAIINPAKNAKVSFDPGLVETLLDNVESKPGSLPLLQFTLREMWGHLDDRRMTRASYDAIGGVEGALSRRAQAIYDALTAKGENTHAVMLFRRLFTRLVTLGEGTEDTRRIVERMELGEEAWELAQRLASEDNRLVVTTGPAPDHETAEVVHEALIRHWPALIDWVGRDRAFQSWLRQLRPRVEEWRKDRSDEGTLLRGGPLAVAEDWLARRSDEVNKEERSFIAVSIKLRDTQRNREKEELKWLAEIAAAQRRTARIQRNLFAALSLLMLVVAGYVLWLYQTNLTQLLVPGPERVNKLNELAVGEQLRGNVDGALRLATHAAALELKLDRSEIAGSPARAALGNIVSQSAWLINSGGSSSATFSPDGKRIVASSNENARILDASTGKEITVLRGHQKLITSAAFSPDGSRIVTASWDNTVRIWDAATGAEITVLRGQQDEVMSAAFSPDGSRIVTASRDKTARIWDAATLAEIVVLIGHENTVWSAAFSPDGSRIVTASEDNTARIWDAATGKTIMVLRGHKYFVMSAAFSPDGSRILTASEDNTARIWDAATGKTITILRGHEQPTGLEPIVYSAAFSPDGSRIVTASVDTTARIWDAATGKEITVLRGHEGEVHSAAFSPDGARIVTASGHNTVRIWDVHFSTMAAKGLIAEACTRLLGSLTTLTREEMRFAGYSDSTPRINVCGTSE